MISVCDQGGQRLITRLYLGENYGCDDDGDQLKLRSFIEVSLSYLGAVIVQL